jgi:hypothetical protein
MAHPRQDHRTGHGEQQRRNDGQDRSDCKQTVGKCLHKRFSLEVSSKLYLRTGFWQACSALMSPQRVEA